MLKPVVTLLATLFAASAFAGGVGLGGIGRGGGGAGPVSSGNDWVGANPSGPVQQVRTVISHLSGCTWPDVTSGYEGEMKPFSCPVENGPDALAKEQKRFNVRFEWCITNARNDACPRQAIGY